jgi:hypothetical protein
VPVKKMNNSNFVKFMLQKNARSRNQDGRKSEIGIKHPGSATQEVR